jgi:hypothetical protein
MSGEEAVALLEELYAAVRACGEGKCWDGRKFVEQPSDIKHLDDIMTKVKGEFNG